ncbi:hypothetical protein [Magnetospirillum sp. 64-120]|uniref:hypothetical protein n=1 Tax=Magnetospirillum sp. 64-120 TaxID=1895778 RepID=UPI000929B335|nr:hypothetical protein [Magnetospirillum sp. 64-120]OJX71777.1 MAG: hypothetical protein BGO92_04070 [Magnetospirillum sp. 64-120]
MEHTCRFCGEAYPNHAEHCRVPGDMDRFERIHALLDSRPDKRFLQSNLQRYLVTFGRWPGPQENSATIGA